MAHPCDTGMCCGHDCSDCLPEPLAVSSVDLPQEDKEEEDNNLSN